MDMIKVEVWRGSIVESRHECAFAIFQSGHGLRQAGGDIAQTVYPRSAIKAFQALPLIESGAAARFNLTDAEIALACASHGGEAAHIASASAMLEKIGCTAKDLECGSHWPMRQGAMRELAARNEEKTALHNNCSGKHAGMLALARHLGADTAGYVELDHPVQREIAATLTGILDVDLAAAPVARDGCSVPTWAVPLENLAAGFARFAAAPDIAAQRRQAADKIIAAVRSHPFHVAGTNRFCTKAMTAVPRCFVKTGAEGVYCGCVPDAGIGIAVKCLDGATRAAEAAMAACLLACDIWDKTESESLAGLANFDIHNWRGLPTGKLRTIMPV